jgi:hypothetical protein
MDSVPTTHVPATAMGRRRRRAIPIVDARFQWKYTLVITALGAGVTAIMGAFLYRAHRENTRILDFAGNAELQRQVGHGDRMFLLYLLALVGLMAIALALWGLLVTHRISGPIHLIASYLRELATGRYPDPRPLRKRDELREFFSAFEDAINALKARDAAALKSVNEALAQARAALTADSKAGLESAIGALERHRELLVATLGGDPTEPA